MPSQRATRSCDDGVSPNLHGLSAYTGALMALGEADTLARRDEVLSFFGWRPETGAG